MYPWRSGNSPTMAVTRSHLPSSAARAAAAVSSASSPAARATWRTRTVTRSDFSAIDPSRSWNTTPSSAAR